jgi:hypothetical protein
MKSKAKILLLLGLAWLLASCSAANAPSAAPESEAGYTLAIEQVSVEQGVKVELMGTTTLPEGNCVYSQLLENGEALSWWPVGKCFPVGSPDWQFSIPLGVEGAPAELDRDAAYCIHIWWPGAPTETLAEFDFDLAPPPGP